VNVTEQLAFAPVAAGTSVQVGELSAPATPVLENATVPVGAVGAPEEVSVTVALHIEAEPTSGLAGVQATVVVVRPRAVIGAGSIVAPGACPESPA